MDIVHHRRKLSLNSTVVKKFDTSHPLLSGGLPNLSKNKQLAHVPNEQMNNSPSTPHFNLQLFDDSDEFHTDEDENEQKNERRGTSHAKRTHEDDDDDDDDNRTSLRHTHSRSHSLDDVSRRSSSMLQRHEDTTRDVLTRRHALDPGAANKLQTYVRHRKDSIVQRVIGYNYDDHSTAGGLYIRVGIGGKRKEIGLM